MSTLVISDTLLPSHAKMYGENCENCFLNRIDLKRILVNFIEFPEAIHGINHSSNIKSIQNTDGSTRFNEYIAIGLRVPLFKFFLIEPMKTQRRIKALSVLERYVVIIGHLHYLRFGSSQPFCT